MRIMRFYIDLLGLQNSKCRKEYLITSCFDNEDDSMKRIRRRNMYIKAIDDFNEQIKDKEKVPYYVYISLNNKCNSNCIFCDVHQEKNKNCIVDVNKLIRELQEAGTGYVHFMGGGEPFVEEKIWDYIKEISDRGMKLAFTTNGLALNREKIEKLSRYNISHMFFSIDGHNSEIHDGIRRVKGIWEAATENIKMSKQYMPQTKIIVNHVLNNRNIDYVKQMVQLSEEVLFDFLNLLLVKGCPELYFSEEQATNYMENIEELTKLIDSSKIDIMYDNIDFFGENSGYKTGRYAPDNYKCYFPMFSAYIDCTSGDVFPCDCTVHRERQKYLCGNLLENSFVDIWRGSKMEQIRQEQIHCPQMCKENCDFANMYFNKKVDLIGV